MADETLNEGIQAGLASGEMQWTGYIFAYKLFQPFYRGVQLDLIQKEIPDLLLFTRKTRNRWGIDTLLGLQLELSALNPAHGHPDCIDEERYLSDCLEHRSFGAKGRYAVVKAQVHYLYGRLEEALEAVVMAQELLEFYSSSISVAALNFYHSLILAAWYHHAPAGERAVYLATIQTNQRQMRTWSDNCAANFLHLHLLVEAELAWLTGRELDGERLYEQAIRSAAEGGFVQDEGLANELASRFYQQRGFETIADAYRREARRAYLRWGATGKVQQLDRQFPRLFEVELAAQGLEAGVSIGQLDALALVKALQAISGNIHLPDLLDTLMHIVIENAGAEKGCLILAQGDELSIAATARVTGEEIHVRQESAPLSASLVPLSLINYVQRTRENILLENASSPNLFSLDGYIARERPLSILCLPILRQSALIGLLYLENNLAQCVFTRDGIAVLELLASQAAISLENSLLFAGVQRENQERKKAEEALRKSEKRLAGIIDFLPDATFAVDRDRKVIAWNRAMEEMSGVAADRMIGTPGTNMQCHFTVCAGTCWSTWFLHLSKKLKRNTCQWRKRGTRSWPKQRCC